MSTPAGRRTGGWLIAGAVVAAVALVAVYLAAGGASYEPTAVADPCEPREWRDPGSPTEAAEQFTLSALDGAACELEVSREELALAVATPEAREAFVAEYGIAEAELEAAVRAGLVRAIDDAERAGALPGFAAGPLRAVASRIPLEEALALIEQAEELFETGGSVLERFGQLLP